MKTTKFKSSEVGPVPEEWGVKRLGECGSFSKGAGISRAQANTGVIPAVRYGELYTTHQDYIKAFESFISEDVARSSTRLTRGDIVFACSGETKEEIGKCAAFIGDEVAYAGGDLIIFSPGGGYDSLFLAFELNTPFCASQKAAAGQGDAVVHIRQNSLAELVVRIPTTLAEQEKIAEALSDVDALLSAMTTLIEKKRAIKQGAMQQLLTGKKRLAGFTGPWVKKRLGGIADFSAATTPVATIDLKWYIGTENMLADKAGVVQNSVAVPYKVVREYVRGDVLTSNIRPYLKKIWLADRRGGCSTDVLVIRTHDNSVCIPEFLLMLISDDAFFDFAMANAVGTKMPRGDKKVLVNFEVKLPTIVEQQAIAAVLSDMDAELAALESKRAKYESVKQGMMQELLTGKVRLV